MPIKFAFLSKMSIDQNAATVSKWTKSWPRKTTLGRFLLSFTDYEKVSDEYDQLFKRQAFSGGRLEARWFYSNAMIFAKIII